MNSTGISWQIKMVLSSIIALQSSSTMSFAGYRVGPAIKTANPVTQPASQPTAQVKIDNFSFNPGELDISAGTTVTWQNGDDVPHTATSQDDPQAFDSGTLDTDDKFSFTFTKPGRYAYYCKVHPHMKGVVVVK